MNLNTLRKPRLGGFVIFDTVLTVAAAMLVSEVFNVDIIITIIILLILSIILHIIFGVNTATNYYLGLSNMPIQ